MPRRVDEEGPLDPVLANYLVDCRARHAINFSVK